MKTIKFLAIIIIILSSYFFFIRKTDEPFFSLIYENKSFPESKISLNYFLGKLPSTMDEMFRIQNIKIDKNFYCINMVRKATFYHNYIFFVDKKDYNKYHLLKNSDSLMYYYVDSENKLSSQIDIKLFNELLKRGNIKGRKNIINLYAYLSSTIGGDTSYQHSENDILPVFMLINNFNDYNKINENADLNFIKHNSADIVNINLIDFESEEKVYYWFKNSGVFEFNFEIGNDSVKSVTDKYLGYIGAEKR